MGKIRVGTFTDSYAANVSAHGAVLIKVTACRPPLAPYTNYLSDLPWNFALSGYGPVERDMSNGETAPRDGHTLTLNGVIYAKGLGVHAPSSVNTTCPVGPHAFCLTWG